MSVFYQHPWCSEEHALPRRLGIRLSEQQDSSDLDEPNEDEKWNRCGFSKSASYISNYDNCRFSPIQQSEKDYPWWQPRFLPGKSETDLKDSGGGQPLLIINKDLREKSNSSDELGNLKKRNIMFIRENQTLQDRIKFLETRLANLEKRKESYHTDENEFESSRKEEPEIPKG
ncbi:hypothetical protein G5I_13928 [Acromyrmex echinatior]|uniref:Uncharacterized protein n=1 Tax=Acromyrmex echinatior TaxID=103372 RepID=F4X6B4_ACREC|nr:hypothetical protein G5I_13928 [Acromyrmex echinatior]